MAELGNVQKARALIVVGGADPAWSVFRVSLGLLAGWEMSGPTRHDGTHRRVTDFVADDGVRQADLAWLAWAALDRPGESFEAWLVNMLDFEWVARDESE